MTSPNPTRSTKTMRKRVGIEMVDIAPQPRRTRGDRRRQEVLNRPNDLGGAERLPAREVLRWRGGFDGWVIRTDRTSTQVPWNYRKLQLLADYALVLRAIDEYIRAGGIE